ncbi:amidase [Salipiger abyssi]|uniref:amidase n=1 Tax=Salipiger abyssi TaxID=1250539 RepID=UPI001A8F24C5|nr:amidase family protein [Salipiger abyssi]MBN9887182.1 amidase [Salipiger abyssi]
MIGAKELSPVELLESCLARIEAVNAPVNGVVAIDREGGLKAARRAEAAVMAGEALGPLHGLPLGIKDLNDTAGLRTTYGSPMFADQVPEKDEHIVANLRAKGALVFAKTNTPEWGAGGNTFNPVYGVSGNPFAPKLTCGGSSGGSAIALSTGMMPLAHGSDNAGSLRIPAAYCGVVGYRPTAGIVASDKRPFGLSHFPVQGPMGRTVADVDLMLRAMATSDAIDPLATPLSPEGDAPVDLSTLRVAFSEDLGFAAVDRGLRKVFRERVGLFDSAFMETGWAHPDFTGTRETYEIIRAFNYIALYAERARDEPDRWGPLVEENLTHAARFSIEEMAIAHMDQTRIYRRAQTFFETVDVLITPTVGAYPWPKHEIYPSKIDDSEMANYFDWVALTYAITMLNLPCISIPCGLDDQGTPFGIQIVGKRNGDLRLLRVARAVEELLAATPALARPVPDIATLSTLPGGDEKLPVR